MKKCFPVFIDNQAFNQSAIYISAGRRGLQIKMAANDLLIACSASTGDLTQKKEDELP